MLTLILFLPVIIFFSLYWFLPAYLAKPLLKVNRTLSALKARHIQVDDHTIHYLEGGSGEQVLILLHGIFAEKDHWVQFTRTLKKDFYLIIPDLPGFGDSSRLKEASYHYEEQSHRLHAFLQALNIEQIHLAGNSMGGALASRFALNYPDKVKSLAFIGAPHGIYSSTESEMSRIIASGGEIPLIARNYEEFNSMLDFLFVEIPWIPHPFYQRTFNLTVNRADSSERLWNWLQKDPFYLNNYLEELDVPVLTLWGDQDRIFHVSGIETLRKRLPTGKHEVMENAGHLPMMEYPSRTAARYQEFLEAILKDIET